MPYSSYSDPTQEMVDQLNAISSRYFDKTIKQLAYEDSVLLKRLKSKKKVTRDGGTQLQWPVRVKKLNTAKAVDPRAQVDWQTRDTRVAATENWRYYFGTTLIQWDERLMNAGKSKIIDLAGDKVDELRQDLMEQVSDDMYDTAAQDEMKLSSLNTMIGTGTYAGIDPTGLEDPTRWQSNVNSAAITDLGLFSHATPANSLAYAINQSTFGADRPTLIITTRDIYTALEDVLLRYYQIPPRDTDTLNLGFENVKFKGIPIVADPKCPEGYIYGIDEKSVEFVVSPKFDFKMSDWKPHENYPNALFRGISLAANFRMKYRHTSFKFTDVTGVGAPS